ncbi:hypothetical protein MRX96_009048 [Rhipicephalus microplus]
MEAGRTSSLTSGREKHVFALHSQGKQQQPGQFFRKEDGDSDVRAECLFTGFLLKHNIPLTAADHVGPLFCKMFPTLDIAERYACARTKSTAIVGEMANHFQEDIVSALVGDAS